MLQHFKMMARYNQWANNRLYGATNALGEDDYFADRGAFFGSIHGTLNHILLADRLWYGRLVGELYQADSLGQILEPTRDGLWSARQQDDRKLIALVDSYEDADFKTEISYENFAGVPATNPIGVILTHVFNHATHHRGQAHGLLSQVPVEPPPLDLMYYIADLKEAANLRQRPRVV